MKKNSYSELTVRAVISGLFVGCLIGASNITIGLKIGWTFGASITAAVVSFAIFKSMGGILKRPYDQKENLITAIEIATEIRDGKPVVPEVCIYFESILYRGNRTTKVNAEHFNAFQSANYPYLAKAGVHLVFHREHARYPGKFRKLLVHKKLNNNIAILKLFPGITPQLLDSILGYEGLKGVILETFGTGNAPTKQWFIERIKKAVDKGIIILNVTQCNMGSVEMGRYETSRYLLNAGVISGYDITTEAATAKLMVLLAQNLKNEEVKMHLNRSLKGEITIP